LHFFLTDTHTVKPFYCVYAFSALTLLVGQ